LRKALIIVNPVAGKGTSLAVRDRLAEALDRHGIEHETVISAYAGEVEVIAREVDTSRFNEVISLGGDGTLGEIINGIVGKPLNLGIVPTGTGNDFIRCLDKDYTIEKAIDKIVSGRVKMTNLGHVNQGFFLNMAGFGIDSYILQNMITIKKFLKGAAGYTFSTFYTLLRYRSRSVTITVDGVTFDRKIMLVAIGNGQYFGGAMKVSPESKVDDDVFEMVIVNDMNRLKFIVTFWKVFKGNHLGVKEVESLKGTYFKVTSKENIPLDIDGNLKGQTPLEIQVAKEKIAIYA